MKKLIFLLMILFSLGLAACGAVSDDDCEQDVAGCDDSDWSCPEADFCYGNKSGCESSGECD